MKLTGQHGGFTIVETLLVLAVTGLLFLIAVFNMLTYLHQNAFNTAVNDLQQQIQAVINTSNNGQYSTVSDSGFSCAPNQPNPPAISTAATDTQGTNTGCQFIGTAMSLGNQGNATTALDTISYYPLVINECSGTPVTPPCTEAFDSLDSSGDNQVSALALHPPTELPLGSSYNLENGLRVTNIYENNHALPLSPSNGVTTVVFGYNFNTIATGTSGTASYSLYQFTGIPPQPPVNMANYFYGGTLGGSALDTVGICVNSGSQNALITIGNNNTTGALSVSIKPLGGTTC